MPEPQLNPNDVFHVIGFTNQDILNGAQIRTLRLSSENLKLMGALAQRFGALSPAAERGLVVKKLVEVYFLDPFSSMEREAFQERFGDYQVVEFFNDTALTLCSELNIQLPPMLSKTTRAQLPDALGISMRFPSFTQA